MSNGDTSIPKNIDVNVPSVARMYDYSWAARTTTRPTGSAVRAAAGAGAEHEGPGGEQPAVPAARRAPPGVGVRDPPVHRPRIRPADPGQRPRGRPARRPRRPGRLHRQRPHRPGARPGAARGERQHRGHPGRHARHRGDPRSPRGDPADRLRRAGRRAVRVGAALHPGRRTTRRAWSAGSRDRLAPGSFLVVCQLVSEDAATRDFVTEFMAKSTGDHWGGCAARRTCTSSWRASDVLEPGLVEVSTWRPDSDLAPKQGPRSGSSSAASAASGDLIDAPGPRPRSGVALECLSQQALCSRPGSATGR